MVYFNRGKNGYGGGWDCESWDDRKYIQAIQCYTEALKEWDKTNRNDVDGGCESWIACVLYSNRAAAQLALKNYGKALEDCKQSLKLGCFEKSYYRQVKNLCVLCVHHLVLTWSI